MRGDARYQSKQYPRSLDLEWYDGYSIGNARLGFSKGENLDISLAQTVLRDIVDTDDANVIMPTDIIAATAQYFRLSVDDLYGSSRSQSVATARQIAMYLCRERTNLSLPKIGQLFGNRDHTTVMYACKKIAELMKERRSIYNQVSEITTQLGRVSR